jgi:hypothetical protein
MAIVFLMRHLAAACLHFPKELGTSRLDSHLETNPAEAVLTSRLRANFIQNAISDDGGWFLLKRPIEEKQPATTAH